MHRKCQTPLHGFFIGLCALVLLYPVPCAASEGSDASPSPPGPSAAEFTLVDQYGKSYQLHFPAEKVSVLVFADRQGSAQVEGWVRPLYERYRESIHIRGVAQLPSVPFPVQGILRAVFRQQVKYPVMLDWDGVVSKRYEYRGQEAALVVVDRRGFIRYRAGGPSRGEILKTCFDIIDQLIQG